MFPVTDQHERGSTLFLFPAAMLVVLVLASITVDFGLVQVRQRELWAIADGAANDAASFGSPPAALRQGEVRIDAGRAREAALAAVAGADEPDIRLVDVAVSADGQSVTVTLEREVRLVIGAGLPGAPPAHTVRARATATLAEDPG